MAEFEGKKYESESGEKIKGFGASSSLLTTTGDKDEDSSLVIDEAAEDENEFEPSVEMMIDDFDDERTLEEEEENENQEDEGEELSALENEQEMPLDELLKMYGYNDGERNGSSLRSSVAPSSRTLLSNPKNSSVSVEEEDGGGNEAEDEEEDENDEDDEENEEENEEETERRRRRDESISHSQSSSLPPPPPPKKPKSELAVFYESGSESRALRSNNVNDDEDSEDGKGVESEEEDRDYSWKKTIMIGPLFQAVVPLGLSTYGDSLPYENDDKQLWDPRCLSPHEVETYLSKSQETASLSCSSNGTGGGVTRIPMGAHIRDDEQALFLLLQCGYNYEEALRRRRMNGVIPADTMSLWSEEECRSFELGLRLYGKDFTMIQQQKVRTRSVGELVQFYYLWKKTERHDVFANSNRLEKKKYTLHPGTTDYMDRFIDEQDQIRDRSSSPNYHSLIYGDSIIVGNNVSKKIQASSKTSNGDIPPITTNPSIG